MSRRASSMDATSLDDWELLPDHQSFLLMEECSNGQVGDDEEAKNPLRPPSEDVRAHDPATDIVDGARAETEQDKITIPKVTEILISDAEEEEEEEEEMVRITTPAVVKEIDQDEVLVEAAPDDDQCAEEEAIVKRNGFSVGNLRVNGVGALCSFGVAAATFCIFLLGGKQQQRQQRQQQRRQNHRIQLQMYADDQRIQQVVRQASMLNQTVSSVMGGASSPRASISFGGYYQGF